MGSISSTNPGLTDLMQTLSSADPSLLSTPGVTTALENASPSDIVQLSEAAVHLQSVKAMFGNPNTSTSSTDLMTQALDSIFGVENSSSTTDPMTQALDSMLGVTNPSSTTDPTTQALDALQGTLGSSTGSAASITQAAEAAALLSSTNLTGSLLDVTG